MALEVAKNEATRQVTAMLEGGVMEVTGSVVVG